MRFDQDIQRLISKMKCFDEEYNLSEDGNRQKQRTSRRVSQNCETWYCRRSIRQLKANYFLSLRQIFRQRYGK